MNPIIPMRSIIPIIIKNILINPLINQSIPLDVEDISLTEVSSVVVPVGILADPPFTIIES
jgi:hypothetical protein